MITGTDRIGRTLSSLNVILLLLLLSECGDLVDINSVKIW